MKDLTDFQHLFVTDLQILSTQKEGSFKWLEQNHFGDFLIEEIETNKERFRLWRNHDENGGGIEIEHMGAVNRYTWETVYTSDGNE